MQYSYKDLYQSCHMESIREHINGTTRLAQLASDFMITLANLYEKFGKDLHDLTVLFQKRTTEELLHLLKDKVMFEKSSLFLCWDKLLQEIYNDGKSFEDVSTQMKAKSVTKLIRCVEYKKRQAQEMSSFRTRLDRMSDNAAAELHKSRVELRQQSLNYEHYRDYYSASKRGEQQKIFQSCVNAHNDYVIQLTAYNKLQKDYHSRSVPQTLQELEAIQTEAIATVADSIQSMSMLSLDRSRVQVDRYDGITDVCKNVSPITDISRYVKLLSPTPNNYQHNLHSFVPELHHSHTPACLLKCRVIHEPFNQVDLMEKKQLLTQHIKDMDTYISQKEMQLKGLAEAEVRLHGNEQATKLYELQHEACKKRNEMNILTLQLAIYKCQMSSMSYTEKQNGAETKEAADTYIKPPTNSTAKSGGGGKSIRAMWKRFAFKATKAKTHSGSLPTSDNSTQNTSEESQIADTHVPERDDTADSAADPDPVYALLRCAAAIRKNSSIDESSGSLRSRQNTISFDISNSSRSSSPNADIDKPYLYPHATSKSNRLSPTGYPVTSCTIPSCPCKHPDVLNNYCKQHLLRFNSRKRRNKN